jgi:hypothetical protein
VDENEKRRTNQAVYLALITAFANAVATAKSTEDLVAATLLLVLALVFFADEPRE